MPRPLRLACLGGLVPAAALLALVLAACTVNPVPTPAAPQGVAGTDAVATRSDASAAADGPTTGDLALAPAGDAAAEDGATASDAKPTGPTPVVGFVPVTLTDAAIDPQFGDHCVASLPNTLGSGRLVVFLPGTGAAPKDYQPIVTEAARMGHRALGLAYPNDQAVAALCGEESTCYEFVRHEVLDGQNRSPKVAIKLVDSIQHRLVAALQHLDKARPAEGWGSFLSGSTLKWAQVTVAGHSLGAGHAAFIGRQYSVARVAMFAGVVDSTAMGPAAWVNNLHATPAAKYFGLAHTADTVYAKINANWTALGLGATRTDIDHTPGPWNTAQGLVATNPLNTAHDGVAKGGPAPSTPKLPAAWRHVIGL